MTLSYILMLVGYVVAGVLFILALRGLSTQETARRGNLYGMIGMAIAVGTMLSVTGENTHPLIAVAIIGGGAVGAFMAMRVGMTQMPELVALLHSFVGLAAVLVGYSLQLTHTVPLVGRSSPAIMRIVVDFPAPFGPRNPVTVPGSTTKLSPSTAVLSP